MNASRKYIYRERNHHLNSKQAKLKLILRKLCLIHLFIFYFKAIIIIVDFLVVVIIFKA